MIDSQANTATSQQNKGQTFYNGKNYNVKSECLISLEFSTNGATASQSLAVKNNMIKNERGRIKKDEMIREEQ